MLPEISHRTEVSNFFKPKRQMSVVAALQRQVANAFNLYLNYKHYHWQTFGPFERDLNVIFDEFASEVYITVEELSERIRMIEQNRVRIRDFRENATIKPAKKSSDIREMIREANRNVSKVISELKELINKVSNYDATFAASLEKILQLHEKHQWWLSYILDKRQGLAAPAREV